MTEHTDAGRGLDRQIAEMLGWTDIREITYWTQDYYDHYEVQALVGWRSGDDDPRLVPHYSTDANAALGLFPPHFGLRIYIHSASEFQVQAYETFPHHCSDEIHESTLPLALCKAWLSFVESHGGDWLAYRQQEGRDG